MTKKVAIIGLGFIGKTIINALENDENLEIGALYDIDHELIEEMLKKHPKSRCMQELTDFDDCDIVIECAVQSVVEGIFDAAIESDKYFIPLSIGAFITVPTLYSKFNNLSKVKKKLILLPSGAIGGFDSIENIALEGFNKVKLQTRKPLKVFASSDYVRSNDIELNAEAPTVIFEGNAKLAATHFPRSINVAARLALSTLGPDETMVEIIADPLISRNIHKIMIISTVGTYQFEFINNPSPTNPKTSWLAALSAVQTVKKIVS